MVAWEEKSNMTGQSAVASSQFPNLFSATELKGLGLRNRLVVAPMTRISADPGGLATDRMAEHYTSFARGGFGLVITEGTYTDETFSQGYKDQPGIANDAQRESWRKVVDSVHDAGARIFMQLIHAGALIQHNDYVDHAIAPSAVKPVGEQAKHYHGVGTFPVPTEMTREQMTQVADGFGEAAARAMEAGFDGIEIHGANGYILDQFLTDYANTRTDEYGGPVENRIRFHLDVLRSVKDAVRDQIPVGIRISQTKVNDLMHEWKGGVQDAEVIFSSLAGAGPSYIHISAHKGCHEVFDSGLSLAGLAKKFSDATVIACGKLQDPEAAEKLLADGEADLVALAKGALADPNWPVHVAGGEIPIPFEPAMIQPLATLENTARWRQENGGQDAPAAAGE